MNATSYLARRLRFTDRGGDLRTVDEAGMLAIPGAKIILAEPGMGKSELLRRAGHVLGVEPVTAISFMLAKNASRFAEPGKLLLIDGLDEAMARREGDAVDQILAQLQDAGCPNFVLSCRAREWQARTINGLRPLYGAEPTVFTIEPFDDQEALAFLARQHPGADAEHVLRHLDEHGLSDFYRNPLTLGLMGRVAETKTALPRTRAALFEQVCALIWPEHDANRQDLGLAKLGEEQALSAAGAIAAGLILAGAEAVSLVGPAHLQEGDVRLADLASLPSAEAASVIVSSKLFVSVGVGRAKPVHRVIGEYLGARWLARQAATPRTRRRLLAQLHGNGVAASLRGLHAWLAVHSSMMAEPVIAADPYGVLRYGETAELTTAQADRLFEALCALSAEDPYFRGTDWDGHTAAGLAVPVLRNKIDAVIGSASSNEHLRSLLIEAVRGTPMAGDLVATLEATVLSGDRFYRAREDAAEALLPHRDRDWWRSTIELLRDQGTEDATRLARHLIDRIDCDVSDDLLVSTLFAEMGVLVCLLPRGSNGRHVTVRSYHWLVWKLPTERLSRVLDIVAEYSGLLRSRDWQSWYDVADVVAALMVRAIDEGAVGPAQAPSFWRWLGVIGRNGHRNREFLRELKDRLGAHDDIRRAIQLYAFSDQRRERPVWKIELELRARLVALSERPADVACLLDRLADADNRNDALREDWRGLMDLGTLAGKIDRDVRASGAKFQRDDAQLAAFVRKLEHPKKPAWELKQERQAAKRERKRKAKFEACRRDYSARRPAICSGELAATLGPARAYLGHFGDLNREQPPADRIAEWLGPELHDDVIAGFEAALHRADLPTAAAVADADADAIARNTIYSYCHLILAGLLVRLRASSGFDDLSSEVLRVGLLVCLNDLILCIDKDVKDLRKALEPLVVATPEARKDFARLWIEPALAAGRSHVRGLYQLAHDVDWQATGGALAAGWLTAYPNVPENIELELVDCLTHARALAPLAAIAADRASGIYRNFNHMLSWLAIEALVRFDKVRPDVDGIGTKHPHFIWFLRNRFRFERGNGGIPVTVAQAKWIVSEFRRAWPYAVLRGSGSGDTNPYDATDFLRGLIGLLANDTGDEATEALQALAAEPADTYSELIVHMAAEQRQKRAEETFEPLPPIRLKELLTEGPPSNADDLKSLVLEELAIAQAQLTGDDLDQVRDFWGDDGVPYDENRCRDRLAAIIGPELARYGVQRMTEADMPKSKRADLAFACGALQLPMEVKGQWHSKVWDAATDQLDAQYLIDWRSGERGIYCVMWFGDLPTKTGRRLKAPPNGLNAPTTAEEMQTMLIDRIPESRRRFIDVVVLDFVAGKP
ncbi:NACHT domain-containing protein [Azospirillum sp. A23]|uniref:NACHT domain-containing protein n=1 Tax=Azospirillum sp. A23 TaxID=3160608 RepID=UPI0036F2CA8B